MEMHANPAYTKTSSMVAPGEQLNTEPVYYSSIKDTKNVPGNSLASAKPGMFQSSVCKRAAVIVACLIGLLVLAGLLAAVFLAFTSLQDLQNRVQELENNARTHNQIPLSYSMLGALLENATEIRQLVEEVKRLNLTLNEDRAESSRGLPGKGHQD